MLYAKCVTIRDAQLLEKQIIRKEQTDEEKAIYRSLPLPESDPCRTNPTIKRRSEGQFGCVEEREAPARRFPQSATAANHRASFAPARHLLCRIGASFPSGKGHA